MEVESLSGGVQGLPRWSPPTSSGSVSPTSGKNDEGEGRAFVARPSLGLAGESVSVGIRQGAEGFHEGEDPAWEDPDLKAKRRASIEVYGEGTDLEDLQNDLEAHIRNKYTHSSKRWRNSVTQITVAKMEGRIDKNGRVISREEFDQPKGPRLHKDGTPVRLKGKSNFDVKPAKGYRPPRFDSHKYPSHHLGDLPRKVAEPLRVLPSRGPSPSPEPSFGPGAGRPKPQPRGHGPSPSPEPSSASLASLAPGGGRLQWAVQRPAARPHTTSRTVREKPPRPDRREGAESYMMSKAEERVRSLPSLICQSAAGDFLLMSFPKNNWSEDAVRVDGWGLDRPTGRGAEGRDFALDFGLDEVPAPKGGPSAPGAAARPRSRAATSMGFTRPGRGGGRGELWDGSQPGSPVPVASPAAGRSRPWSTFMSEDPESMMDEPLDSGPSLDEIPLLPFIHCESTHSLGGAVLGKLHSQISSVSGRDLISMAPGGFVGSDATRKAGKAEAGRGRKFNATLPDALHAKAHASETATPPGPPSPTKLGLGVRAHLDVAAGGPSGSPVARGISSKLTRTTSLQVGVKRLQANSFSRSMRNMRSVSRKPPPKIKDNIFDSSDEDDDAGVSSGSDVDPSYDGPRFDPKLNPGADSDDEADREAEKRARAERELRKEAELRAQRKKEKEAAYWEDLCQGPEEDNDRLLGRAVPLMVGPLGGTGGRARFEWSKQMDEMRATAAARPPPPSPPPEREAGEEGAEGGKGHGGGENAPPRPSASRSSGGTEASDPSPAAAAEEEEEKEEEKDAAPPPVAELNVETMLDAAGAGQGPRRRRASINDLRRVWRNAGRGAGEKFLTNVAMRHAPAAEGATQEDLEDTRDALLPAELRPRGRERAQVTLRHLQKRVAHAKFPGLLNLSHTALARVDFGLLYRLLHANRHLHTLDLSHCRLSDDALSGLYFAVRGFTNISTLVLRGNRGITTKDSGLGLVLKMLEPVDARPSSAASPSSAAATPKTPGGGVRRTASAFALVRVATSPPARGGGGEGEDAADTRDFHLTKIVLGGLRLGNSGAAKVAGVLSVLRRYGGLLESLDLGGCEIGEPGALALGHMLEKNDILHEIVLQWNPLGRGSVAIGDALGSNIALRRMDLSRCSVGDAGMSALCQGLSSNIGLEDCDLSGNSITSASMPEVAAMLLSNRALRRLDIGANPLGASGLSVLMETLLTTGQLPRVKVLNAGLLVSKVAGGTAPGPLMFNPRRPGGRYSLDLADPRQRATAAELVALWEAQGPQCWRAAKLDGRDFELTEKLRWPARLPHEGALEVDLHVPTALDAPMQACDMRWLIAHLRDENAKSMWGVEVLQVAAALTVFTAADIREVMGSFKFPRERTEAIVAALGRCEGADAALELLLAASPSSAAEALARLGMQPFNPKHPAGAHRLELERVEHVRVAEALVLLSEREGAWRRSHHFAGMRQVTIEPPPAPPPPPPADADAGDKDGKGKGKGGKEEKGKKEGKKGKGKGKGAAAPPPPVPARREPIRIIPLGEGGMRRALRRRGTLRFTFVSHARPVGGGIPPDDFGRLLAALSQDLGPTFAPAAVKALGRLAHGGKDALRCAPCYSPGEGEAGPEGMALSRFRSVGHVVLQTVRQAREAAARATRAAAAAEIAAARVAAEGSDKARLSGGGRGSARQLGRTGSLKMSSRPSLTFAVAAVAPERLIPVKDEARGFAAALARLRDVAGDIAITTSHLMLLLTLFDEPHQVECLVLLLARCTDTHNLPRVLLEVSRPVAEELVRRVGWPLLRVPFAHQLDGFRFRLQLADPGDRYVALQLYKLAARTTPYVGERLGPSWVNVTIDGRAPPHAQWKDGVPIWDTLRKMSVVDELTGKSPCLEVNVRTGPVRRRVLAAVTIQCNARAMLTRRAVARMIKDKFSAPILYPGPEPELEEDVAPPSRVWALGTPPPARESYAEGPRNPLHLAWEAAMLEYHEAVRLRWVGAISRVCYSLKVLKFRRWGRQADADLWSEAFSRRLVEVGLGMDMAPPRRSQA